MTHENETAARDTSVYCSTFTTLLAAFDSVPVHTMIQERSCVCVMHAKRCISAQRSLDSMIAILPARSSAYVLMGVKAWCLDPLEWVRRFCLTRAPMYRHPIRCPGFGIRHVMSRSREDVELRSCHSTNCLVFRSRRCASAPTAIHTCIDSARISPELARASVNMVAHAYI